MIQAIIDWISSNLPFCMVALSEFITVLRVGNLSKKSASNVVIDDVASLRDYHKKMYEDLEKLLKNKGD